MLPRPSWNEFTRPRSLAVDTNVAIGMRDGTILYADLFRPAGGGRFPVLLSRIPYGKHRPQYHSMYLDPVRAVARGYAVVIQDVRGRHMSEGEFYPFRDEAHDGFDTVEWCAAQPWSDGNVGMFGISYHGATQWLAAVAAPPSLRAIVPGVTSDSYFDSWLYQGGAFNPVFGSVWPGGHLVHSVKGPPSGRSDAVGRLRKWQEDPLTIAEYLPANGMPAFRGLADYYYDWLAHPSYDAYWKGFDPCRRFDRVRIPVLNWGGYYDGFVRGTVRCYEGMRKRGGSELSRRQQHLLLGPWTHEPLPPATAGERDFGGHASGEALDLHGMTLAWFDRWLKEEDNGIDTDPAVYYFTMGEDGWHPAEEWPPPGAGELLMFLGSGGNANTAQGDGTLSRDPGPDGDTPDRYVYDPADAVPTLGGAHLHGVPGVFLTGVREQGPEGARRDVVVYTSDPLESDLEVTGNVTVSLWAITSARDTDWTAKLLDVLPDGRSFNVCDGILRARFRNSFEAPVAVTPGEPHHVEIDLGPTSLVFGRGHRIRLHVSSSNFPAHSRNLNTGGVNADEFEPVVAHQTLLHEPGHPSHLRLPARWR